MRADPYFAPTIARLAEKYKGRAVVCKVNADTAKQLARTHGITALPTVVFFDGGEETRRFVGLRPQEDYEDALNNLLK